jgi:phosphatidylglycerophosphatase A
VSASADPPPSDVAAPPQNQPALQRKPRFALFVATACGLGYIPKAPGTFGALIGCLLTFVPVVPWLPIGRTLAAPLYRLLFPLLKGRFWWTMWPCLIPVLVIGALGVWSGSRAASHAGVEDPQYVVIDEVSGQQITYLLGLMPFFLSRVTTNNPDFVGYPFLFTERLLHWKYLLMGFILFRLFDIWKPFPVRQAESLPGGWGIMADDWVAAVYAGIGLWIARAAGL